MTSVSIANCRVVAWQGRAWRIHRGRYQATDPGGSLKVSGRFHQGADLFPAEECWPALYLALAPETALAELVRHVTPELLPHLNDYQLTEVEVILRQVADCRDPERLNLTIDQLTGNADLGVTRNLGAAVLAAGYEGLLVPSATALGDNLVVLTSQLQLGSGLRATRSQHPRLRRDG